MSVVSTGLARAEIFGTVAGLFLWIRKSFLRFTLSSSVLVAVAAVGFELAGHGVNAALSGITAIFLFLYAFTGFVVLRLIGYSS